MIFGEGISAANIDGDWIGSLRYMMIDDGYWIRVDEDIDEFQWECGEDLARGNISVQDVSPTPEEFLFNQSTAQAFYFIEDVVIDGEPIAKDDWLIAYQGDKVVGARQWTGGFTDVPAMGDDGSEKTINYMDEYSTPQFKLFKEGSLIDLEGDVPAWSNNEVFMVSSLKAAATLPESFSINNAYPNPFNPVTTLSFALPVEVKVSIKVINLQGREVMSLINETMQAGYHSVDWNAESESSGVYFLNISAGDFISTQKLMLIK